MKNQLRMTLIAFMMTLSMTACTNGGVVSEANQTPPEDHQQVENRNENENPTDGQVSNRPEDTLTKTLDALGWSMSSLKSQLDINTDQDIVFYSIEDYDQDSADELILALGKKDQDNPDNDFIEEVDYIGRQDQVYRLIDQVKPSGYSIFSADIIELKGLETPALYLRNTNDMGMIGFELYKIESDKLSLMVYSASPTGAGYDEMIQGEDGRYEGYVQNTSSYDTLYIPLVRTYVYEEGEFVLQSVAVAQSVNVPSEPEEVVLQYLNLMTIQATEEMEITGIDQCIDALYPNHEAPPIVYSYDVMYDYNTLYGGALSFESTVDEANQTAVVIVTYSGEEAFSKTSYQLRKIEDKWQITDLHLMLND